MPTINDKLDELEREADLLLRLLKDRHPGLMTWNDFLGTRLRNLRKLIHEAVGRDG